MPIQSHAHRQYSAVALACNDSRLHATDYAGRAVLVSHTAGTLNWTNSALGLYNACDAPTSNHDGSVFAYKADALEFTKVLPWLCVTVFAIGGLVAALYLLRFLRNWQLEKPDDENSLLSQFRELHRTGELSAEEFREVRISLAEQMRSQDDESGADER